MKLYYIMWLLNNQTPFAAERTWVRDENGAEEWLVAVKGSFVIEQNGKQVLDKNQIEVCRIPVFIGEAGNSSLLNECDLVHKKENTDVFIHGHAYSPNGEASKCIAVRLKVANIEKTLLVHGNRLWKQGILGVGLSDAESFLKMPITYERSFGGCDPRGEGWEPRNPVGTGFAKHKENIVGGLAPNIEDPNWPPYKDCRKGRAAGFGPIARHWAPRVELAGTYDEKWESTKSPLLPSDFDTRFYQCAPEDQQVPGFLKGGELVELLNLTPEGYLSFHLPKVSFGIRTRFYDGSEENQRAKIHTLIIQPDKKSFQIIWHTNLPCHQKVNQLKETTIVLKKRIRQSDDELRAGMWREE